MAYNVDSLAMGLSDKKIGPFISSPRIRILLIVLFFALLITARQLHGGFGFSVGYLYVAIISVSGFWFGVRGGLVAALFASSIFYAEIILFPSLINVDVAYNSITVRIFVYVMAGVVMGYLSWLGNRKNEKIDKLSRAKSKLIGIASHDLRSPLQGIVLSAGMLTDDNVSAERRIEAAKNILNSSNAMLSLINDLLDVSKIESGKLGIHKDELNYIELVMCNVETNRPLADQSGVSIEVEADNSLPSFSADANRIGQVVGNLIGNAIKYGGSGGLVKVCVLQRQGEVLTKVVDCGPGIEIHERCEIFKPFYRVSNQADSSFSEKHVGLGLAIAKNVVEAHGGRIWVEDNPQGGSVFCFTLPLDDAQ